MTLKPTHSLRGRQNLPTEGRLLLREGPVCLMNTQHKYQMLLFNNLIMLSVQQTGSSFSAFSRPPAQEILLDLAFVWLQDLENLDPQTSKQDAFEIYTPERPYTIFAGSLAEKLLWVSTITEAVQRHLGRQPDDSISERNGLFTYHDGVYEGHFSDSQRHGTGVFRWNNMAMYDGEWVDNMCHGSGRLIYASGETYVGQFADGKPRTSRVHWRAVSPVRYARELSPRVDGPVAGGRVVVRRRRGHPAHRHWRHVHRSLAQRPQAWQGARGSGVTAVADVQHADTGANARLVEDAWESLAPSSRRSAWLICAGAQGRIDYVNGDVFTGFWDRDEIVGAGRLICRNGASYDGMWDRSMVGRHIAAISARSGRR